MSVLKRFRTQAKLEFFSNAEKLRRDLFFLVARDFGIKDHVRTVEMLTSRMTPEDRAVFIAIAQKYEINKFTAEYPEWIISKCRDSIWDLTRQLLLTLTAANSIYPTCRAEADQRRVFQDQAVGNCEQLLKELEFMIGVFPVVSKKYMPYVETIEREITLVKAWRKSDHKRFQTLP